MRALLRDAKSQRYLSITGEWTPSTDRARDFKSVERAIQHAEENQLKGIELVVTCGEPPRLRALPDELLSPPACTVTHRHD